MWAEPTASNRPWILVRDVVTGAVSIGACWAVGFAVERWIPASPFPPSVTGMIVLWIALERGWIPERRVRTLASFLVRYLGLWFVPVGVGIVAYGDLVRSNLFAIVVSIGVGTVVALAIAAAAAYLFRRVDRVDDSGVRTDATVSMDEARS